MTDPMTFLYFTLPLIGQQVLNRASYWLTDSSQGIVGELPLDKVMIATAAFSDIQGWIYHHRFILPCLKMTIQFTSALQGCER